jgi:ornithine cyclodeaminase
MRAGTHLTCVGSDTAEKQEVAADVLGQANLVVADSISQCLERGEIHHAIREGRIVKDDVVELGDVAAGRAPGRTSNEQVTVADLTGVAVQDVAVATAVWEGVTRR